MSQPWVLRASVPLASALILGLAAAPAYADTPVLVAVGDSWPAAAGVGEANSFPAVAAALAGYDVHNNAVSGSTSGAITGQLTGGDVIVINTGGNNVDALESIPKVLAGDAGFAARLPALHDQLVADYKAVADAEPDARVIVMDYADFLGPCVGGDVAAAHEAAAGLNSTILAAAADAGVEALDVSGAFKGHTVCDPDPYAYGTSGKAPGHPTEAGHEALGELLATKLGGAESSVEQVAAAPEDTTPAPVVADDLPAVPTTVDDSWLSFVLQYQDEIETWLGYPVSW